MSLGHSNYLSPPRLPPLSAVHMPMLIPRRPKRKASGLSLCEPGKGRTLAGTYSLGESKRSKPTANKVSGEPPPPSLCGRDFILFFAARCRQCCCWTFDPADQLDYFLLHVNPQRLACFGPRATVGCSWVLLMQQQASKINRSKGHGVFFSDYFSTKED